MYNKKSKVITMNKDDFIKEHKRLIKVLEHGSKSKLISEANKQKRELKKYK